MLKYYYYEIDGAWGAGGDGGRDGSRHALGMLKYYYYETGHGGGGEEHELN